MGYGLWGLGFRGLGDYRGHSIVPRSSSARGYKYSLQSPPRMDQRKRLRVERFRLGA